MSLRLLKKKFRRQGARAAKHCRFCGNKDQMIEMDYKNVPFLRGFLTERGKILPSRISGNCCLHQRDLSKIVKKARMLALLPYCSPRY
ncbi:30S ribosomal protein S18 [bacterium]|nr:30S ribosomal protein S18 [bacterium]